MAEHERRALDKEIRQIAEEVSTVTINKLFLTLGIDISEPEGMIALQDDFRHMRLMRTVSNRLGNQAVGLTWKLIVGSLLVFLSIKVGIPLEKYVKFLGG